MKILALAFYLLILPQFAFAQSPYAGAKTGLAFAISRLNQPQIEKATMWVAFCLFLKVSGKELGSLGLRFLIHLGVVSER